MAKKTLETGEGCNSIPENMRQFMTMQDMDPKSLGGNFLDRTGIMPYDNGNMANGGEQGPQGKVGMLIAGLPRFCSADFL